MLWPEFQGCTWSSCCENPVSKRNKSAQAFFFFPQWSCFLLAGTRTQGAGRNKASWSQQGCNHQDDEVRGNPSASSVETEACGTLTDLSLCTCVINCIHNFLLSKHVVGFNKMFLSTLCCTMCIQVTGGWWMDKNSRTALQQTLTSTDNYLKRGVVRGDQTLSVKQLGRVGNERQSESSQPCPWFPQFSPKSSWFPSMSILPFALPKPHLGTSSPLPILPLHFQEWLWSPSKCCFTGTAEIAEQPGELGFHCEAASIFQFLTCLNLKVTKVWKLPCNCIWVSLVPLIFLAWKSWC